MISLCCLHYLFYLVATFQFEEQKTESNCDSELTSVIQKTKSVNEVKHEIKSRYQLQKFPSIPKLLLSSNCGTCMFSIQKQMVPDLALIQDRETLICLKHPASWFSSQPLPKVTLQLMAT